MVADPGSMHGYRFRVSDAVAVPLRGMLLRLRLVDGRADIRQLRPGDRLKLVAPDGHERVVDIMDWGVTGGRQTQTRLDTTREFDIVISGEDALQGGDPVEIGWHAVAP